MGVDGRRLLPPVRVEVDVRRPVVLVGMRMELPAQGAAQGQRPQHDQHHRHQRLESVADRGGNGEAQGEDQASDRAQ